MKNNKKLNVNLKSRATKISGISRHMKRLNDLGIVDNWGNITFYDMHKKYFPKMAHPNTLFKAFCMAFD